MFVYDLFFYLKPEFEDYLITDYLCSLSGNNQIIFETINISGTDNMRIVRVTVPYEDSLDEKYSPKANTLLQKSFLFFVNSKVF